MVSGKKIDFCALAESSLQNSKAQDIVKIDLVNKSSLCDYILIATGTSSRHVSSIIMNLKKDFKAVGVRHIDAEGNENSNWVILDIGDIIVHVFQSDTRHHYKLEELWGRDREKPEV